MCRGSRAIIAFFITGCKPFEAITFTAKGCCPSCETSILESLQIDAIKSAQWNQQNEEISWRDYSNEISADQLQRKVAMAGYDADLFMAPDSVYLALPKCCHNRD